MDQTALSQVIQRCNKFNGNTRNLWAFCILNHPHPVGYMLDHHVQKIGWLQPEFNIDVARRQVHLNPEVLDGEDEVDKCSQALVSLCRENIAAIGSDIEKWLQRAEDFHSVASTDMKLFRVAVPTPLRGIIGVITRGVHLNVYGVRSVSGEKQLGVWVAKRSSTVTYANQLDQIAAGAMSPDDRMCHLRTLGREAEEEAGLILDWQSKKLAQDGRVIGEPIYSSYVSFYDQKDRVAGSEIGHLEPGVRYIYDLFVDSSFIPKPHDQDAIEGFYLLTGRQIVDSLLRNEWKPNSGLVMLDFLVRNASLVEDGGNLQALRSSLRRRLPFGHIPFDGDDGAAH